MCSEDVWMETCIEWLQSYYSQRHRNTKSILVSVSNKRLFILHNIMRNLKEPPVVSNHSPYEYDKASGRNPQDHKFHGDDTDERSEGHKWHRE